MDSDVVILLVDDDRGHATLIKRNLKQAGIINPIIHFSDGEEVLNFLASHGKDPATPEHVPFLMLLDIRMPKVDGFEVLRQVKNHPENKNIPVIMVTTSDNPQMMDSCKELGCVNYIVKPVDYTMFRERIRQLGHYIKTMEVPRIKL